MTDTPSENDVLASVGEAVLLSQTLEAAMRMCLIFVFQDDPPLTLEKLEAKECRERRKTIGYFINALRQRVRIREDFENLLNSLLARRNKLIHRVTEIEGWDLKTTSGREHAKTFADGISSDAALLLTIFAGFISSWQSQVELGGPPIPPELHALFASIDSQYASRIDTLIGQRDE